MTDAFVSWGYYNVVSPKDPDGTVHIGAVSWDGEPPLPVCKKTRSRKFIPINGYVPRRRLCKACLAHMRKEWRAG